MENADRDVFYAGAGAGKSSSHRFYRTKGCGNSSGDRGAFRHAFDGFGIVFTLAGGVFVGISDASAYTDDVHPCCDGRQIIFVERARRSEGLMFSLGYKVFRAFHRLLTGIPLRFGNFSLVPGTLVKTLPLVSETWSHYAAAVIKAALPYRSIPTHRGTRIAGKSTMRLPALIAHGLSAISVFAEIVSVRLLVFGGAISIPIVLFMLVVVTVRLTTNLGVPGWATYSSLLLLTLLLQILALVGGLSLGLHAFRNSLTFIPLRDYRWFIGQLQRVGVLNEGGR